MGIGKFAARAVSWISKAIKWWKGNRAARAIVRGVLAEVADQVPRAQRYLGELDKLERGIGANTRLFDKVERAKARIKRGTPDVTVTLDAAEIEYLFLFKKLWDKYVKRPLRSLGGKLDR